MKQTTLLFVWLVFLSMTHWSCQESKPLIWQELSVPAGSNTVFPNMDIWDKQLYLCWTDESDSLRSSLNLASWKDEQWSEVSEIVSGRDWFVNWADFPSIRFWENGQYLAHTLVKSSPDTYAYDIVLQQGSIHQSLLAQFKAHEDSSQTEHGFVSMLPISEGIMGVCWLDGRNYAGEKPSNKMMLMYREFSTSGPLGPAQIIDDNVCSCCQTDLAMSKTGPVVVYRDRSDKEIRDIYISRKIDGKWLKPKPVFSDNWQIGGCPVNGPAIVAQDSLILVAWYSMANADAKVQVTISRDNGEHFSKPIQIDQGNALGRVDLAIDHLGKAWISWIEGTEASAEILIRRISDTDQAGPSHHISSIDPARASGFPILKSLDNRLFISWTETQPDNHVRMMYCNLD